MRIGQGEQIIGIQIDRLITSLIHRTGKSTFIGHSEFASRTFIKGFVVQTRNHRSDIQGLICLIALTIGIIKKNSPVLDRLCLKTSGQSQAIILCLSISSTLQIRNHGQFGKVSVRINRTNRGAKTCQRMIKSLRKSTGTKRSVIIGMHKLSVNLHFQPICDLRSKIGVEI